MVPCREHAEHVEAGEGTDARKGGGRGNPENSFQTYGIEATTQPCCQLPAVLSDSPYPSPALAGLRAVPSPAFADVVSSRQGTIGVAALFVSSRQGTIGVVALYVSSRQGTIKWVGEMC